jgi:hypothetical protein
MSKFTFTCEEDPMPFMESVSATRTVEFDADSLDSILEEFALFLKGCGFNIDGQIQIVNELEGFTDELNE